MRKAGGGASLRRVRRALLLTAVVPLAVACGGGLDGGTVLERAQKGLRGLGSTTVRIHVTVRAAIPVERGFGVSASELPKLELTRWAKDPRRIDCAGGLDCAEADVDVDAALRALGPVLPSLPIDPEDVRSAKLRVAVEKDGRTRYLHLLGDVHVTLLGDVPFEADLDVPS